MFKKIVSHPLFSGSFLMFFGSMLVNAFSYLYHLIMGRVLGPVHYGALASIFSILYVVSIIPGSASFAIVKFISSAKNHKERSLIYQGIKRLIVRIAVGGLVVLAISTPIIANFLHLEEKFAVFLVGPVLFFSLVTLANQSSMQGNLKFFG